MGSEAAVTLRYRGKTVNGKARLETSDLQFRGGDVRLTIPFTAMSTIVARGGTLSITFPDGLAELDLGSLAEKWAQKIRHPPSRLAKIGVKPDWRASAIGVTDDAFLAELEGAVAHLSIGRVTKHNDAIFFGVTHESQLSRLDTLKASLKPNGAIWVVRPKGRAEISERATMAAGKRAGLVDVKVVGFSPTHTAEKFVIPVAAR
jgi:hypothetical protein